MFGFGFFDDSFKHERCVIDLFYEVARKVLDTVESFKMLVVRGERDGGCHVEFVRDFLQRSLEIGRRGE